LMDSKTPPFGLRCVRTFGGASSFVLIDLSMLAEGRVAHRLGRTRRGMLRPRPNYLPSDTYMLTEGDLEGTVRGHQAQRRPSSRKSPFPRREQGSMTYAPFGAPVVRLCGM
jgi:hypothetical protein